MVFNSKAAEYHFNSKYLIKTFKGQNNLKLKLKYIPPIIDKNIIQKFRNLKKKYKEGNSLIWKFKL